MSLYRNPLRERAELLSETFLGGTQQRDLQG